jgi:hypothetical protein
MDGRQKDLSSRPGWRRQTELAAWQATGSTSGEGGHSRPRNIDSDVLHHLETLFVGNPVEIMPRFGRGGARARIRAGDQT